ncbi:unnamed protein product [Trichobilharzia regenti]|nr:unnamed protein product [Trichobilharzia regenti]
MWFILHHNLINSDSSRYLELLGSFLDYAFSKCDYIRLEGNYSHDVYATVPQSKLSRNHLSEGGFILEEEVSNHYPYTEKDEELSDPELGAVAKPRKRRRVCQKQSNTEIQNRFINEPDVPLPPDQEKPICDLCSKTFEESFLRKTFEVDVCDRCR